MTTQTYNLSEKDILEDSLISQKQLTESYNTFSGECVNPQLRGAMMNILMDEHNIQADIFSCMQQKGYYQLENADAQQIMKVKKKFGCI